MTPRIRGRARPEPPPTAVASSAHARFKRGTRCPALRRGGSDTLLQTERFLHLACDTRRGGPTRDVRVDVDSRTCVSRVTARGPIHLLPACSRWDRQARRLHPRQSPAAPAMQHARLDDRRARCGDAGTPSLGWNSGLSEGTSSGRRVRAFATQTRACTPHRRALVGGHDA